MATITEPQLSRAEWKAVSIAFSDAAQCGCAAAPGPIRRALAALTGREPPRPLADPRLEAIRGFVCDTRRHRRPAEALVPALEAQGFTRGQVDALALLAA